MGSLLNTLWRSAILDDAAFMEWRERPNVFLRGIVLIILVTLIAEIVVFGVNLVNQVQPVDVTSVQQEMDDIYNQQLRWMPELDPEVQEAWDDMMNAMFPMIQDISEVNTPLPRGITGLLNAVGGWLSRSVAAVGGWLFYGALVLIMVRLLGGSGKLPVFLGTVALYIVPGLLAVLEPIPCLGPLLAFAAMVWSIVVYIKATSVASGLEVGRAIVAVVAPILIIVLLGGLILTMMVVWMAIIF